MSDGTWSVLKVKLTLAVGVGLEIVAGLSFLFADEVQSAGLGISEHAQVGTSDDLDQQTQIVAFDERLVVKGSERNWKQVVKESLLERVGFLLHSSLPIL